MWVLHLLLSVSNSPNLYSSYSSAISQASVRQSGAHPILQPPASKTCSFPHPPILIASRYLCLLIPSQGSLRERPTRVEPGSSQTPKPNILHNYWYRTRWRVSPLVLSYLVYYYYLEVAPRRLALHVTRHALMPYMPYTSPNLTSQYQRPITIPLIWRYIYREIRTAIGIFGDISV